MLRSLLALFTMLALFGPALAQPEKIPIIFDTDIGTDIDDSFALALILASPELELRGVTTVSADAYTRGLIAARMLGLTGNNWGRSKSWTWAWLDCSSQPPAARPATWRCWAAMRSCRAPRTTWRRSRHWTFTERTSARTCTAWAARCNSC